MTKEEFIEYTKENFNASVDFLRLLENILSFVQSFGMEEEDCHGVLWGLLDGTIGYDKEEIEQINL